MKKTLVDFWTKNQRVRAYTYMLLHGLASYVAISVQNNQTLSIIFGVVFNAVIYDLSKLIEKHKDK